MKRFVMLIILVFSAIALSQNYVTVSGAGTNSGADWANAYSLSDWITDIGASSGGETYYVEAGTYVMTADGNWNTKDGSSAAPYVLIGVKSGTTAEPPTYSDWAFTTDRPILDFEGYLWDIGDYWRLHNFDCNGHDTDVIDLENYCFVYNCKVINVSGTVNQTGFRVNSNCSILYSEFSSTAGYGLECGSSSNASFCYFGGDKGFVPVSNSTSVYNSAFTSTRGIFLSFDHLTVINCTFKGCTYGIDDTSDGANCLILNCAFDDCTTEAEWNSTVPANYWDWNCWESSPTHTNVTQGPNADETDFALNSGVTNFTLINSSQSPTGHALTLDPNVGVVGTYPLNAGADQSENVTGGGGTVIGGGIVR